jgi:modulator of FtsH protease HflC
MSNKLLIVGIVGVAVIFGALNSFFIVNQTQQALVLRFGKPVDIVTKAGLKFKTPFMDSVLMFDKRMITMNAEPKSVILQDQDRLVVDAYVTYRINDPLRFYQAVRSDIVMQQRLEKMLETSLREVLGREDLNSLLSSNREKIMTTIRENVARLASGREIVVGNKTIAPPKDLSASAPTEAAEDASDELKKRLQQAKTRDGFGVEIVDVRIMRTDLPKETSDPIYNRMRSDRQKVAEKFRAEGQKESQIITSEAERERTVIMAEAERKASIIRGEGDGEASKIFAESFGKDPEFFEFYRTMQAYKSSLKKEDTTLILSPDNSFLKFIEKGK